MKKLYNIDIQEDQLYKLLQNHFLLLFASIIAGIIGINVLPIPVEPFILFLAITVGLYSGCIILNKSLTSPFFIYFIAQFIFIWMFLDERFPGKFGISFKVNALVLGISTLTSAYYFFKNFDYLWQKYPALRYLVIFFIINIPYFLFYHSDFNLANYKTGYDLRFNSDNESSNASFIIFLDSLCPLVGYILGLMVNRYTKTKIEGIRIFKKFINTVTLTFIGYYSIIFFAFLIGFNKIEFMNNRLQGSFVGDYGPQVFLSFFFILFFGFKVFNDNFEEIYDKKLNKFFIVLMGITALLLFLMFNRTSLFALFICITIFYFLIKSFGLKLKTIDLKSRSRRFLKTIFNLSFIIIPVLTVLYLLVCPPEFLIDKIEETFSQTTMNVRKTNWDLFIIEWKDRLSIKNILFGFGLGASRETIFFVSAMQGAGHLVQTVHNHLIEVIYDYGCIGFFYFMSYLYIFFKSLKNLRRYPNTKVKLLSTINIILLLFFFIYHQTDGIRVTTGLILFSMLGVIDSTLYKLTTSEKD